MKIIGTIQDGDGVTSTIELERDKYDERALSDLRAAVPPNSTLVRVDKN